MNTPTTLLLGAIALSTAMANAEITLESAPPVVVRTVPAAGATNVDPATTEIRVTFSKAMQDGNWSWTTWGETNFPQTTDKPRYLADGKTCVLPVKLVAGKFYATWLNSDKFRNFQDAAGNPAVPYLLTFRTSSESPAPQEAKPTPASGKLNADQSAVVAWTDRQFRSFLDRRSFETTPAPERTAMETRLIETLKGPMSQDYYRAINTLGAMRSTNALPELRRIAFDRADKNNRDRWMAIRSIGLIGDRTAVPELIHLVYHGNQNTRWWAQVALVWITGQNFGSDWNAWAKWWNDVGGEPRYSPEIIRWWKGQPNDDKLAESLRESDRTFLNQINGGK